MKNPLLKAGRSGVNYSLTLMLAALIAGTAGCQTAGYKQADKTGEGINTLRNDVVEMKAAVDGSLKALDELAAAATTDPRKPYQASLEEQEVKKGGIIIPDTAKEKPQEGKVVALGTGKIDDNGKKVDFTVKKGDKVLISKYGGTEIKIDDENYLIMREDDILGIIG